MNLLTRILNPEIEFATRDDKIVIRRSRAFGLIAFALMSIGALVVGHQDELRSMLYALLLILAALPVSFLIAPLRGGRLARPLVHCVLGLALIALTFVAIRIGSTASTNVTLPSLLVVISCHILGTRAAAGWTLAALASLAVAISVPELEDPEGYHDKASFFASRALVMLGFCWTAIASRRVADKRAEEIEFLARHDSLTGLLSRWEFDQHLRDAIARAARHRRRVALVFIDLDGFKGVNDLYGHLAGDFVLKQVGVRIAEITRSTDAAARLGGDEFVILINEVGDEATAHLCAARLVELLSEPIDITGQLVQVGASAGIAIYPDDACDASSLTDAGDKAMYAAKRQPGSSVRKYSDLRATGDLGVGA